MFCDVQICKYADVQMNCQMICNKLLKKLANNLKTQNKLMVPA